MEPAEDAPLREIYVENKCDNNVFMWIKYSGFAGQKGTGMVTGYGRIVVSGGMRN